MPKVSIRGGEKLKKFFDEAGKGGVRVVQVGVFASAKYPDGTSVAYVAATNEFGIGVPERPAIRIGIKKQEKVILAMLKEKVDPQTMIVDKHLGGLVGASLQGAVQQSIVALKTPPNSQATIDAKGSSNPLIDTDLYLNSITYKVIT